MFIYIENVRLLEILPVPWLLRMRKEFTPFWWKHIQTPSSRSLNKAETKWLDSA